MRRPYHALREADSALRGADARPLGEPAESPVVMKAALIVAALLVLGLYGAVVGLLACQQRRFLYGPDTSPPDLEAAGVATARVTTMHTSDGLDLLAWSVPPRDPTAPVVLYFHGNGGNIGYRSRRLARFSRFGWGVFLLEYRGYGGNGGTPTEAGLVEDAHAAYAMLRADGIPASRIVLWGESLGAGVAVRLASEVAVGAVLLESPYTSIAAMAKIRFPYAPVDWLIRDRFELVSRIGAVHVPVLVMTGGRDAIVPPAMGRAVFAAANEPKVFWFAPEAGHIGLVEAGALEAAHGFIQDHWTAPP